MSQSWCHLLATAVVSSAKAFRLHKAALVPRAQLFCVSDILAGLLIYGIQRNRGLPACCATDCAGCVPITSS
jgi:hypothetical protein